MTTSTGEPYRPRPLCAEPNVDPEWWVTLHAGRCPKGCPHGLAAHLCLDHCPLLEECQGILALSYSDEYLGMVLGGMMKTRTTQRGPNIFQVPEALYDSCETCKTRQRASA